jgi:NADPH:quinone reductase-like Zn-dependent oxidoreductase
MKAVITKGYGGVEVLELENIEKPTIEDNEILVEVKATSINPLDWRIRSGELKMMTGKVPPPRVLGSDYAGVISQVGHNITNYKQGDEVFGQINGMKIKEGTYAQYLKVTQTDIAFKPDNISFEEAASIPLVSSTAYTALNKIAKLQKGQHVFINGGTGGVGSASIQIAKALGAIVTTSVSAKNIDHAKTLGADIVMDYNKDDVLTSTQKYDVIFDTVGKLVFSKVAHTLVKKGVFVTTDATLPAIFLAPIANLFRSRKLKVVMVKPDNSTLVTLKNMVEKEALKPYIFKSFMLEEIKEAHLLSQKGGFCGKLTVTL